MFNTWGGFINLFVNLIKLFLYWEYNVSFLKSFYVNVIDL